MPECQFTTQYFNYEIRKQDDFKCQEPLVSEFCIFHDKGYLQDKANNKEHKQEVLDGLKRKVNHAISNHEPLFCVGFQLPDFSLSDLISDLSIISKEFSEPVYFSQANFQGEVNFHEAKFQREADFINSEFYGKTYFSTHFNAETNFNYVLFEAKEKVIFDIENLSNVSFMNTDLTGVRFSDKARWGGEENTKEDRFKIVDERLLEKEIERKKRNKKNIKPAIENERAIQEDEKKDGDTTKEFNLGSIKAVYRNLRENYEYRMRYDEAGQFFIREMELKRMYREASSISIFKQRMYKLLRWLKLRNKPY